MPAAAAQGAQGTPTEPSPAEAAVTDVGLQHMVCKQALLGTGKAGTGLPLYSLLNRVTGNSQARRCTKKQGKAAAREAAQKFLPLK